MTKYNRVCPECGHEFVIETNKYYFTKKNLTCPQCGYVAQGGTDSKWTPTEARWNWEAHGMTPPPPNTDTRIHAVVNNYNFDREEEYYNQLTENLSNKIADLVKSQDMPMDMNKLKKEINNLIQNDIPIGVTYDWAMNSYQGVK